ncbi:unnamed protein product [Spirodela intermedia]|uniref:RING-type E3 ubiquitin transferase n=2 Tax=Spirodela intermedia TaxID=51605 RepID=A0A7I8KXM0_SPIIN|nr:unnamed protein product [Spirodela intermedia]CAA6665797.1 unnamed protein product [Spirodela intermedia]CAA7402553.1 unnamed protein product [Spirodela intermedia]
MEFLSFYGTENFFDRHSDLRLDIDSMSYEELLALEEQIGDVKTGLSREAILEKLKTRSCTTRSLSKAPSDHMPENGTCIICQVEYAEKERIGTLDCGHEYHAGCITEWLLVKNLCPVCKTTAVPADGIER